MSSVPSPTARGPSRKLVVVLVVGMLVTGCSNSLWSKYQDMQCVANCDSPDPARRQNFEQPVWQTANMFLGEMCCLVAFNLLNSRLNPFRGAAQRRKASAAARQAALASTSARLGADPLSRPDESAFAWGNSAISLQGQHGRRGDVETGNVPQSKSIAGAEAHAINDEEREGQEAKMNWKEALMFWAPATCDIAGTTAMNVGLFFVPVSIFQMLRGALVLWVGVFSVIFLNRKLDRAQWTALAVCMIGVAIVGSSSLIGVEPVEPAAEAEPAVSPLVGVLLILVAQLFTATQFVLEERIMEHHSVEPLLAAGYEGFFGLFTTMSGLLLIYRLYGSTPSGRGGYFDVEVGWNQIVQHPRVWQSSIVIAISIALFNFCGLAVTRNVSATARSTIDTCRTLGIWLVSLYLGWETFKLLQVVGFALLVYGTFVFNSITRFPAWTNLHPDHEVVVVPASPYAASETDSLLGSGGSSDDESAEGALSRYDATGTRAARSSKVVGRRED
ncbi:hypothetical protein JCM10212_003994 [Sporobolomyces blumeae]